MARDVVITGIGLASSQGEGIETHAQALAANAAPVIDTESFAPYPVHPLKPLELDRQIPKKSDQRQMEPWQRLGVYAAGLALDGAGLKQDVQAKSELQVIVAAGGGERDHAVDAAVLTGLRGANSPGAFLNERLMGDLRPTLFLAQLSNLLAGNISIVHKVTGSSRTFMGEEGAGVAAVETAAARIRSGQSSHMLVGAAFQTEHHDMLLGYELAGYLHRGPWAPVWQRQASEGGGLISGSGGAFLVLESREHAEKRGRKAYAQLGPVFSGRARRQKEDLAAAIGALVAKAAGDKPIMAVSGASGANAATAAESNALDAMPNVVPRAFSTVVGHLKEAQFPFAVALAALAVHNRSSYPVFDADSEKPFEGDMSAVLATTVGYHQFEGVARVLAAD
jgi:3-oxoacyl-[acyl-carrier-protein] synthase II